MQPANPVLIKLKTDIEGVKLEQPIATIAAHALKNTLVACRGDPTAKRAGWRRRRRRRRGSGGWRCTHGG